MVRNYMPLNTELFNVFQNNIYNVIVANAERWGIPATAIAILTAIRTIWVAALTDFNTQSSRTHAVIRTKNNVQKEYTSKLRMFIKSYLINNMAVTDADKLDMALPVYDNTRTPAPTPTTRPSLTIDFSQIGRHTVNVRNEGANNLARPKGVVGYELRALIGDATEPSIENMPMIGMSLKSARLVEYTSANRGKFVWYVARWVNSHEENGPWSEMVGALIN